MTFVAIALPLVQLTILAASSCRGWRSKQITTTCRGCARAGIISITTLVQLLLLVQLPPRIPLRVSTAEHPHQGFNRIAIRINFAVTSAAVTSAAVAVRSGS
jgi:hypothetical protein